MIEKEKFQVSIDLGDRPPSPLEQLLLAREQIGGRLDDAAASFAGAYNELSRLHREILTHLPAGNARQQPPEFLSDARTVAVLKSLLASAFSPVSPGSYYQSPFGTADRNALPLGELFRRQHAHLTTKKEAR